MTLDEAFKECEKRYYDGDTVHCVHGGKSSENMYIVKTGTFRTIINRVVCDDKNLNTPFIVLYNGDADMFAPIHMASTDPRITGLLTSVKKAPHFTELVETVVEAAKELNKYEKIGGIIGSLQKYQKEETLLDIQLRNFKMK